MYYFDYYKKEQKEDNYDHIKKTVFEIMKIKNALDKTDNYRATLSEIVHSHVQDILKYKDITRVDVSNFLWINYINNYIISPNMIVHFLALMFKVLLAKNSIEKIEEYIYNHYVI